MATKKQAPVMEQMAQIPADSLFAKLNVDARFDGQPGSVNVAGSPFCKLRIQSPTPGPIYLPSTVFVDLIGVLERVSQFLGPERDIDITFSARRVDDTVGQNK